VTLFEADGEIGGQIRLARKATWRAPLGGVVEWYGREMARLGVDVRLGRRADADAVRAVQPDIVVVATGGLPNKGEFDGHDLAVSTWDILSGRVAPGQVALVYDDHGYNQAPSCAEAMLALGSAVEIATPERAIADEMTGSNFAIHLRNLYKAGARISPDVALKRVEPAGNRLRAVLVNVYSGAEEERLVDQVVAEHGTLPDTTLFDTLRPHSRNLGETDWEALVASAPQTRVNNTAGSFMLFRVGDAVASRDIHAAVHDALRLCHVM
jgi:NADPH-dependent 2,4-dienoyl-CoA reductase/sulfur reductase-like enzyme